MLHYELDRIPGDQPLQHLNTNVCLLLLDIQCEITAFLNREVVYLSLLDEFPF
jgi:hypothetical protein